MNPTEWPNYRAALEETIKWGRLPGVPGEQHAGGCPGPSGGTCTCGASRALEMHRALVDLTVLLRGELDKGVSATLASFAPRDKAEIEGLLRTIEEAARVPDDLRMR